MARHGLCCSLDDMCAAAAWLLKFGGKFCVCLRPERLCELMCKMNAAGIEPKRLRTVSKRDALRRGSFLSRDGAAESPE